MAPMIMTSLKLSPEDRERADRLRAAVGCSTSTLLRAALHEIDEDDLDRLRARVETIYDRSSASKRAAAARRRRAVLRALADSEQGATFRELTAATGLPIDRLREHVYELVDRGLVRQTGHGIRNHPYLFALAEPAEEARAA
jgi:hypothetical protein